MGQKLHMHLITYSPSDNATTTMSIQISSKEEHQNLQAWALYACRIQIKTRLQ